MAPETALPRHRRPLDILEIAGAQTAFLSPGMLEEFPNIPGALDKLARLDEIVYGGGPLSKSTGTKIVSATRLRNLWGSTKAGCIPMLQVDREDWAYMAFEPNYSGIEWRQQGEDLFEMVFINKPDTLQYLAVFVLYPDITEWPTRDIWSKHPTKPHHWHYEGRLDDLICQRWEQV